MRPLDQEIGPLPAQAVFPIDPAAGVDDPLQERLQEQLGSGFLVVEPLHPMLRMLPEEFLKGLQERVHVQPAVREDVPLIFK